MKTKDPFITQQPAGFVIFNPTTRRVNPHLFNEGQKDIALESGYTIRPVFLQPPIEIHPRKLWAILKEVDPSLELDPFETVDFCQELAARLTSEITGEWKSLLAREIIRYDQERNDE